MSAIDRLARRNRDLDDLVEPFDKRHVELIPVRERIDTPGPMGRFVLSMMGSIARLERELIASRVKQGMAHREPQGGFLGHAPVGTIAVRGADMLRRLRPHPQHAKAVERDWCGRSSSRGRHRPRGAIDAVEGQLAGIAAAEAILARDDEALAQLATKVQTGPERLPAATQDERQAVLGGIIERFTLSREHISLEPCVPGMDGSLDWQEWRTQQDSNLRPSA